MQSTDTRLQPQHVTNPTAASGHSSVDQQVMGHFTQMRTMLSSFISQKQQTTICTAFCNYLALQPSISCLCYRRKKSTQHIRTLKLPPFSAEYLRTNSYFCLSFTHPGLSCITTLLVCVYGLSVCVPVLSCRDVTDLGQLSLLSSTVGLC